MEGAEDPACANPGAHPALLDLLIDWTFLLEVPCHGEHQWCSSPSAHSMPQGSWGQNSRQSDLGRLHVFPLLSTCEIQCNHYFSSLKGMVIKRTLWIPGNEK